MFTLLFFSGISIRSVAGDFSLDGYAKSYLYLFRSTSFQDPTLGDIRPSDEVLSSNRFRLNASYRPRPWLRLDGAYDLAPRIQSEGLSESSPFFGRVDPFFYRVVDLDPYLYPSETEDVHHFAFGHNLDRAAVTFRSRPVDLTFGRQAIAWGNARVINPTDVLAPFTFDTLDTEDRVGIDAARARIPLGTLSEIDLGYVFGRDFKFHNSAFYARTEFNAVRTDFSFLVMGFRENLLAGIDLAGSIGDAGFWLETAYVFTDAFNERSGNSSDDNYFRATSGVDYNLTGDTYAFIEYHFNGAGAGNPRDYVDLYTETAYAEGAVYLMGRHYCIPGVVYQYTPLVTLTLQSLINVGDPSVSLSPQVDYNISPSVYVGAGAFIGIGEKPAIGNVQESIVLRSEFGAYPDIFFASLRYYF